MSEMRERLSERVRSSSSIPREWAIAKEAVARALVLGNERAVLADGGSHMFVKRTGEPGTCREERVLASLVEVVGLKVDI